MSARIFLTRNAERVLPGKLRRTPRPFNAYEPWSIGHCHPWEQPVCHLAGWIDFCWSTGSPWPIGCDDAHQTRGYGRGFKLSEFRKKSCFCQGHLDCRGSPGLFSQNRRAQPRRPVAAPTGAAGPAPAPRIVTPGPANVPGQRVPRAIPALPRRDRESSKED